MPASLLSVNGRLRSLYEQASVDEVRSTGYNQLDIGKPLMIRYLHFFLIHKTGERENELMISTFLKASESKEAAAETVNFFDNKVRFGSGDELRITDFGAARYGHPLCYYTRSYLGESIFLTTKIMELDKVDQQMVDAIKGGIRTVVSLPFFAEFLPYAVGATVGVTLFQKLFDLFNKDDAIVEGHNLDLHFGLQHVRRLQSGRIVCIPDREESEIMGSGRYALSVDNRLVDVETGEEYRDSSYFVIQVDARPNKKYESFNYMMGAAELLKMTNRGEDPTEYISTMIDLFKGYNDIAAMQEIEDLSIDADDETVRKKIKALYRSMSQETRALYKDRVKTLTAVGT